MAVNVNIDNIDFGYLMKNQGELSQKISEEKIIVEYDYKIVSFRIGNEYYGIDIMSVKEILKENKFTKVPNTLNFVVGVYNLRGEIIPVIDLAKMFNLKVKSDNNDKSSLKSIIVIKVENLLIGLIVEQIQRVIPLKRKDIQPPSPLLGSINEKFITGVIELDNKLYVIFDTDSIFSSKEKSKKEVIQKVSDLTEDFFIHFCNQIEGLSNICINEFNRDYFRELYLQYASENKIIDPPNITKDISNSILEKFYSMHTEKFWSESYADKFYNAINKELNAICSDEIRILNIGCGNGHEAFSLYILMNKFFENSEIKMVACDMNLNKISNASGFEIFIKDLPNWVNPTKYFMKLDNDIYKIKKEINNKIYFEFHDARNIGTFTKQFDIVVARDLSLNLSNDDYKQFLDNLCLKIIPKGILIIGDNEIINKHQEFTRIMNQTIKIYKRK